MGTLSSIVLYSRPRCPLCSEAREALQEAGLAFTDVDVSSDGALEAGYGTSVPVVEVAGLLVFEGGMDPNHLPTLVLEASRRRL